jgi:hypothetical protein
MTLIAATMALIVVVGLVLVLVDHITISFQLLQKITSFLCEPRPTKKLVKCFACCCVQDLHPPPIPANFVAALTVECMIMSVINYEGTSAVTRHGSLLQIKSKLLEKAFSATRFRH